MVEGKWAPVDIRLKCLNLVAICYHPNQVKEKVL
jgi:hypothetical protein